jgi:hypothetical protein
MPAKDVEIMPVPRPCGICGRPTTQRHKMLDMPWCGRDGGASPAQREVDEDGFGPPLRGRRRWWRAPGPDSLARTP